jgi:hypothetical protein
MRKYPFMPSDKMTLETELISRCHDHANIFVTPFSVFTRLIETLTNSDYFT